MSIAVRVISNFYNQDDRPEKRSAVVNQLGEVFVWGNTRDIGVPEDDVFGSAIPTKIEGLPPMLMVSCGECFTAILSDTGSVWTWGDIGTGQTFYEEFPTEVPRNVFGDAVLMVSCGIAHTIALTVVGQVFTTGRGDDGALGHENYEFSSNFEIVGRLAEIPCRMVAAGNAHSVALGQDGIVWTWGSGMMGQLGQSVAVTNHTPGAVFSEFGGGAHRVEFVAAGGAHTAAITTTGVLWTWGGGTCGQLGLTREWNVSRNKNTPTRVTMPLCIGTALENQVMSISCAPFHSLILKRNGTIWGCGSNTNCQLAPESLTGHRRESDYIFTPQQLGRQFQNTKFVSICATLDGSSAVDHNGTLWQWGRGLTWAIGGGIDRLAMSLPIGRCQEIPEAACVAFCMGPMSRLAMRDEPPYCAMRNGFDNNDLIYNILLLCQVWPPGQLGQLLRHRPGILRLLGGFLVRHSIFAPDV